MNKLVLHPVRDGSLALTHRPKRDAFAAWKDLGVTHVVTLLSERENARDLGQAAVRAGIEWIWIPMEGAAVPNDAATRVLLPAVDQVARIIAQGGRVVVHCSAGIHRTGMFGYAVLRRLGMPPEEARTKLGDLRAVTAAGVGTERLAWGDKLNDVVGPAS